MKPFKIKSIPAISFGINEPEGGAANRLCSLSYRLKKQDHWSIEEAALSKLSLKEVRIQGLALFSQLMELYVSADLPRPYEALIWSALERFVGHFVPALDGDLRARLELGYACLLAHIVSEDCCAGLSHGCSETLHAHHGGCALEIQASLMAELTDFQIQLFSERLPDGVSHEKYVMIGELLAARPFETGEEACASLVGTLRRWISRLEIEKLSLTADDLEILIPQILDQDLLFFQQIKPDPVELKHILQRRCR